MIWRMSGGGSARWAWVLAAVFGAATVGLVWVAVVADQGTVDRVLGVVGAVLTFAGFLFTVWQARRTDAGAQVARIEAGGNIDVAVIGNGNRLGPVGTTPASPGSRPASGPPTGEVRASGDIRTGIVGDDNTVER